MENLGDSDTNTCDLRRKAEEGCIKKRDVLLYEMCTLSIHLCAISSLQQQIPQKWEIIPSPSFRGLGHKMPSG